MCVAFVRTKTSIHSTSFVTWFTTRSIRNWILKIFPPASSSILLHIKRAYLQSYVWLRSPFTSLVINPFEYGYKLQEDDDDEVLKPNIMTISLPEDLPIPCRCRKCSRADV